VQNVKARERLTADDDRAGNQRCAKRRKQACKQQREISRSHPAGAAQGIAARREDRDRGEAAEHHARPEILRRTNFHVC
jgi:hypothetical protein